MKKEYLISLVVLGFTSVIAQIAIVRELIAGFYGNEFFIGWALFAWLLWTSLGSSYAGARPRKDASLAKVLAFCSAGVAALVFFAVIFIRSNRLFLGQAPGVLPDLVPSLLYSFFAVGPLCFLLGAQFTLVLRMFLLTPTGLDPARVTGKAYFLETAGFIVGGIAFSFVLVRANVFLGINLIAGLNFFIAVLILFRKKRIWAYAALVIFSFLVTFSALSSGSLEKATTQWRFPSEKLVTSKNTLRANIAVTRLGEQYNFYQNGMLVGSGREAMAGEYLVHFPMLAHPAPRRLLFLGMGFNGPLKEILKHNPDGIVAVDLDPEFNTLAAQYLPEDLQTALSDGRVRFWHGDGRSFLQGSSERFDVIIANFPDPMSILANRNYTGKFFQQIKEHLAPGGIFATRLGFAANYVAPELERLGISVFATLREAFSTVKVLPEDTAYFLASSGGEDFSDIGEMAKRIGERHLSLDFVTPDYLTYRFTNDRVRQVATIFENSVWKLKNRDLKPQSYYFAFARWLGQFHSRASGVLLKTAELPFPVVVIAILLLFAWPLVFSGSPEGNAGRLSLAAMRVGGFTVMTFEIILIYLFQVFFGDLYYRIAGLITALMAGIGIGAWGATLLKVRSARAMLAGIHFVAILFYVALIVTVHGVRNALTLSGFHEVLFYWFAVMSGALAGLEFPFANNFFLKKGKGGRAGEVYAADLFGSCVGALLTAGFLLPIWGVKPTLAILVAMNAMIFLFLLFRKNLGRKDL